MIVLLAWLAVAADRPEIALLPLDAPPGTDSRATHVLVRGLAAALEEEGRYRAVVDAELLGRVGRGQDERVRQARDALVEGRRLLSSGDPEFALVFLLESTAAWADVSASLAWRQEAADAWYNLARAQLATGDRGGAEASLSTALTLVPDYLSTSADARDPAIDAIAPDVIDQLVTIPTLALSSAGAVAIENQLDTPYLVAGAVHADGAIALTVWAGASAVHVVERAGPFRPGAVGDPWYRDMAAEVAAAAWGDPIPVARVLRPVSPVDVDAPDRARGRAKWVLPVVGSVVAAGALGAATWAVWPEPSTAAPAWSLTVYPAP